MNANLIVSLVTCISVLIVFNLIYQRKRPYFEKKRYQKQNNLNAFKKVQIIEGSLIQNAGPRLRIGNSIEIRPNVYWTELFLTVPSGGNGSPEKLIDAIYFKSNQFLYYRYIFQDPAIFIGSILDYESSILPQNIIDYLKRNGLSIDSGSWGLLLMKNAGYFKCDEVDDVINDTEKNIKYLVKKSK